MADLSKLDDKDLEAIASGDMSSVSDAALAMLAGEQSEPAAPQTGPLEAGAEAVRQGAFLGYVPQLKGAGAAAGDLLAGGGIEGAKQAYLSKRDETSRELARMQQEQPVASFVGTMAGGMAMPGLGAAKGVGLGAKMLKGAGLGAGVGAAYNPGDAEGQISPIQAEDRAVNAGIGALLGAGAAGAGRALEKGAEAQKYIRAVKDSAGLSKQVRAEIEKAGRSLTEKQISPRANALNELLRGKSIEVNPQMMEGVDPRIKGIVEKFGQERPAGMQELSAKNAQRLKRYMDQVEANYGKAALFDPTARAKSEEAKKVADVFRNKLSALDPSVSQLNREMADNIRLRDVMLDKSRNAPISAIKGKPGTDRGSLVDAMDQAAGSDLEGLSQNIENAADLMLDPTRLVKPLEAPSELRRLGTRGLLLGADALNKGASVMGGRGSPGQITLMEAIRAAETEKNRK